MSITPRDVPLVERAGYERFVRAAFTGRGGIEQLLARIVPRGARRRSALQAAGLHREALPRELILEQ